MFSAVRLFINLHGELQAAGLEVRLIACTVNRLFPLLFLSEVAFQRGEFVLNSRGRPPGRPPKAVPLSAGAPPWERAPLSERALPCPGSVSCARPSCAGVVYCAACGAGSGGTADTGEPPQEITSAPSSAEQISGARRPRTDIPTPVLACGGPLTD